MNLRVIRLVCSGVLSGTLPDIHTVGSVVVRRSLHDLSLIQETFALWFMMTSMRFRACAHRVPSRASDAVSLEEEVRIETRAFLGQLDGVTSISALHRSTLMRPMVPITR